MRPAGLAILAAALGPLPLGCGGEDSRPAGDGVEVRDFEFAPRSFTAATGERVEWENAGDQIHNVKGDRFFSRAMNAGETYSFTFRKPGEYDYVCTLHPQMRGTIVVD
jgi:plastocyanin